MSLNSISSGAIDTSQFSQYGTPGSLGAANPETQAVVGELLQLIAKLLGADGTDQGQGAGQGAGGGQGAGQGQGVGQGQGQGAGAPGCQGAGGPAQSAFTDSPTDINGLKDIKLNTSAGGEALHLKVDDKGNLFNGSGNSVGKIDLETGAVTLNSGATQEMERLAMGGRDNVPLDEVSPGTEGAGGSRSWSGDQITVSVGDVGQKADF